MTTAGGIPAITSSMKHVFGQSGVVRGSKALLAVNQMTGFDCPGCAWPEPDDERSMTEFCENGAKAIAEETTTKRVTPEFFANYKIEELAAWSEYELSQSGRLTHPMVKLEGASHYTPIGWDDAFDLLAEQLRNLASPNEATFYTSGRTSNEAAFLYQLLVRRFGTNNLPDCSNMCHESSGVALNESIGIGKGTVTLADFDEADVILVMGQNPGTNHPRMLTSLQRAVRSGCQIVSINPLKEAGLDHFIHPQELLSLVGKGTALASMWIQPRINGDLALLKGVMKLLIEHNSINREFVEQHTVGYEVLCEDLKSTSWESIVDVSGVTRIEIEKLTEIVKKSQRMIICWAMGLTQHKNGVATIQQAVNLLLLGGHFGRPGAGVCPVRGHSNVQGDRTMGINEKAPAWFLDKLEKRFNFISPREHGFNTVESIRAMLDGKVKVFFGMGGNFVSATPDSTLTEKALSRCDLTVHVSTKLNRSHVVTGKMALILPCLGRTEKDQMVSVENSMGVVQASRGVLAPASTKLKSEVVIVAELGKRLAHDIVDWDALAANYDLIRDHIEAVIPGFKNYNVRVRQRGGFYLPNAVKDQLEFRTVSGKGEFKIHPIEKIELADDEYLLMTIRSHDQFNTTLYGLNDRYRGISNERRVLFMNRDDIKGRKRVDIVSHWNGKMRIAKNFRIVPYNIPRQCAAAYFPETNILVPIDQIADKSHTPVYKSIRVSLKGL